MATSNHVTTNQVGLFCLRIQSDDKKTYKDLVVQRLTATLGRTTDKKPHKNQAPDYIGIV